MIIRGPGLPALPPPTQVSRSSAALAPSQLLPSHLHGAAESRTPGTGNWRPSKLRAMDLMVPRTVNWSRVLCNSGDSAHHLSSHGDPATPGCVWKKWRRCDSLLSPLQPDSHCPRRTAGPEATPGPTPRPSLQNLCSERPIPYFWLQLTQVRQGGRDRLVTLQVELIRTGFPWPDCLWKQSRWALSLPPGGCPPRGSSLSFPAMSKDQMISSQNRLRMTNTTEQAKSTLVILRLLQA